MTDLTNAKSVLLMERISGAEVLDRFLGGVSEGELSERGVSEGFTALRCLMSSDVKVGQGTLHSFCVVSGGG